MKFKPIIPILAIILATSGCKSFSSTLLQRDLSNLGYEKLKLKGYPITLKVPTHIRVEVVQRTYMNTEGELLRTSDDCPVTTTNFKTHFIETEKIFTCDYKRPGSGSANTNTVFTPDGYIDTIQLAANDDTITQSSLAAQRLITNLAGGTVADETVATVSGGFLSGVSAGNGETLRSTRDTTSVILPPGTTTTETERVDLELQGYEIIEYLVASKLFDLDDPDVEGSINRFIECHCCP